MSTLTLSSNGPSKTFPLLLLSLLFVMVFVTTSLVQQQQDPRSNAATGYPVGFSEVLFVSGLSEPTQMTFAPDGRLFVNQKGGSTRVIKNGQLLSTPFSTVSVDSFNERGLMGIAFDPNFATNRYVYIYYTRSQGPIKNRVSRFTASATNLDVAELGSEVVLLDDIASDAGNHNGGALLFDQDGKLYISIGDGGANSSNAQNLGNLSGKILRMNPVPDNPQTSGVDERIPTDNPPSFKNGSGQTVTTVGLMRLIWAMGVRNPFTMAIDSQDGKIYVNDVGAGSMEEVNLLIKGANYGWPTCEGSCSNANFTNPIHDYGRSIGATVVGGAFYRGNQYPASYNGVYFFGDYTSDWIRVLDPNAGNTVSLFASNSPSIVNFAMGPDGSIYYLLIDTGRVYRIAYNGAGITPTTTPTPLPPGAQTITFNDQPSSGALNGQYPAGVVNWGTNVWALSGPYTGFSTNSISFNGAGPTSGAFSFVSPRRLLSIDATNGGTVSSTATIACTGNTTKTQAISVGQTMTIPTGFTNTCTTVTITSSNGWDTNFDNFVHDGTTGTATPTPTPTNQSPVAGIATPVSGTKYNAGNTINYSGTGTDAEDGTLPASAFSWTIVFHHADTPATAHTHPFLGPINGVKSGSFQIPTIGESSANTSYRIHLTVTDSDGATHEVTRDITPNTANITLQTTPTGLQVTLDGQPRTAPHTISGVVGFTRSIGATSPQTIGSNTHQFLSWSDSGAQTHDVTTPVSNTTYTATFQLVTTPTPTPTRTPTPTPTSTPIPLPTPTPTPSGAKPGDLNGDNQVNIFDLSILLSNYGTTNAVADINKDGNVNIFDLSILLSNFGQ